MGGRIMKQFYVKEYLKNPERRVVTRDGSPVRIICIDRAGMNTKPIVALITLPNGDEAIKSYWENGIETRENEDRNDLFFAPEKRTDYINLYYNGSSYYLGGAVYTSEEEAKRIAAGDEYYITTIKAEWED